MRRQIAVRFASPWAVLAVVTVVLVAVAIILRSLRLNERMPTLT